MVEVTTSKKHISIAITEFFYQNLFLKYDLEIFIYLIFK